MKRLVIVALIFIMSFFTYFGMLTGFVVSESCCTNGSDCEGLSECQLDLVDEGPVHNLLFIIMAFSLVVLLNIVTKKSLLK